MVLQDYLTSFPNRIKIVGCLLNYYCFLYYCTGGSSLSRFMSQLESACSFDWSWSGLLAWREMVCILFFVNRLRNKIFRGYTVFCDFWNDLDLDLWHWAQFPRRCELLAWREMVCILFFANRLINKNFRGYTDSMRYAIFDAKLWWPLAVKRFDLQKTGYHIRAQLVEIYQYTCFGAICYSSLNPSLNTSLTWRTWQFLTKCCLCTLHMIFCVHCMRFLCKEFTYCTLVEALIWMHMQRQDVKRIGGNVCKTWLQTLNNEHLSYFIKIHGGASTPSARKDEAKVCLDNKNTYLNTIKMCCLHAWTVLGCISI